MPFPKPIVTREHGSWAVFLIPLASGAGVAGAGTPNLVLLVLASLGIFMSYVPIQTLIREKTGAMQGHEKISASRLWAGIYAGFGLIPAVLLLVQGLWSLVVIGLLAALFFGLHFVLVRAYQKTAAGDFVAMLGLTLTAPASYYVGTGALDARAALLWLAHVLFFGSNIVYVHMKIRGTGARKEKFTPREKLSIGGANLLYHAFLVAMVVLVMPTVHRPEFAGLAFLPMIAHAVYGTLNLAERVRFKQLGLLLLGHSVFFGLFISIALA
jgi:hypothetical protein